MSGFSADWLALREPFDTAARAGGLAGLRAAWAHRRPIRILDLATGTGANLRYLAPHLGGDQQWLLLDCDASLLSAIPQEISRWAETRGFATVTVDADCPVIRGPGFSVRTQCLEFDLAAGLDGLPLAEVQLVTASALLDLVSEDWLERLADACDEARCATLFALTYDGHIGWTPVDEDDGLVRGLLNRHQLTDKGFGPALGPAAAATADRLFRARRYRTVETATAWQIDAGATVMQSRLIDDWGAAASEVAPCHAARIAAWRSRRLRQLERGGSRVTVGHTDLLALPG